MSLQYKTEAYIVKTIRQAAFEEREPGRWVASQPLFGLVVEGRDKDEAEQRLLIHLTAYVLGMQFAGKELPVVEGIDVSLPADADPEQAWFWSPQWQQGEREADEDIRTGRVERFDSGDALLTAFSD
jgi:hypothetical protein